VSASELPEGVPESAQEASTDVAEGTDAFDDADTIDIAEGSGAVVDGSAMTTAATTTVVGRARNFVQSNPMAGYPLLGIVGFMGVTFAIAVVKTMARGASSTGRRAKQVNKNLAVVTELSKYLPDDRSGLSGRAIAGIRLRTGFKPAEIFRKYLWYLLRERKYVSCLRLRVCPCLSMSVAVGSKFSRPCLLLSRTHTRTYHSRKHCRFGPDCVDDLVALRAALDLSDDDLAAAMKERAERVYAQFGTVMMDTSSMTNAGIERKATAKLLFSKMLYLLECEQLWTNGGESEAEERSEMLRDVFGASSDDVAKLRLASIHSSEIDLEKLYSGNDGDGGGTGGAGAGTDQA